MRARILRSPAALLALLAAALLALPGCERVEEAVREIAGRLRPPRRGGTSMTDADRIIRKFGQPRQRVGVGRGAHTEHGIRHNRKWYYYYASPGGAGETVRIVYFMDDRFAGSVIQRPDGTLIRERITFPF
ncbi:MAG: hypothetical protein PHN82_10420 [bacterium]|nr:hypothetical protein [bacterium]